MIAPQLEIDVHVNPQLDSEAARVCHGSKGFEFLCRALPLYCRSLGFEGSLGHSSGCSRASSPRLKDVLLEVCNPIVAPVAGFVATLQPGSGDLVVLRRAAPSPRPPPRRSGRPARSVDDCVCHGPGEPPGLERLVNGPFEAVLAGAPAPPARPPARPANGRVGAGLVYTPGDLAADGGRWPSPAQLEARGKRVVAFSNDGAYGGAFLHGFLPRFRYPENKVKLFRPWPLCRPGIAGREYPPPEGRPFSIVQARSRSVAARRRPGVSFSPARPPRTQGGAQRLSLFWGALTLYSGEADSGALTAERCRAVVECGLSPAGDFVAPALLARCAVWWRHVSAEEAPGLPLACRAAGAGDGGWALAPRAAGCPEGHGPGAPRTGLENRGLRAALAAAGLPLAALGPLDLP
eukprot:tig00000093_g3649.t1